MIFNHTHYVPSPDYHWFYEGKLLTICRSDYYEGYEAQFEVSDEKEKRLIECLVQENTHFESVCEEIGLINQEYSSLVEDLIDQGILIERQESYVSAQYMIKDRMLAFLPAGLKVHHEVWLRAVERWSQVQFDMSFVPVLHPLLERAYAKYDGNWISVYCLGTYKATFFAANTCFFCYKSRLFSNYPLAKRFYHSDQILHVGYRWVDPPELSIGFQNDVDEVDLHSGKITRLWSFLDCKKCCAEADYVVV